MAEYIADKYKAWEAICKQRFDIVKRNEERINEKFISLYGLSDEMDSLVDSKDISVRLAERERDIKSLLSYAVGCIFGRYSLDCEGIAYAGGKWTEEKYKTYIPTSENVIPITDEQYFDNDIIGHLCKWLEVVYGKESLEDNLEFIAMSLGGKGKTSRETIREYFIKGFFSDHCRIYQKAPIYWMVDSGKSNGFKAIMYIHRYNADTIGMVRTSYLHKAQQYIESAKKRAEYILETTTSGNEKAYAKKSIDKYTKQLAELKLYDEAMAHIANQRIALDLDDGIRTNYEKFQGIEVSQEGKKALIIDLLTKIK